MIIENDPIFNEFVENRRVTASTIRQYAFRLGAYCSYTQLSLGELIKEAEDEEDAMIRMPKRKIKKHLMGFCKHLQNQGKSSSHIRGCFVIVKAFYKEYEIVLPNIRCLQREQKELLTTKDILTKDDIKKALKRCNTKYTAIIKLMMSSGMGRSEIINLTLKDYLDSLNLKREPELSELIPTLREREKVEKIPQWSIYRYKTKTPYITFSTPETIEAINNHIETETENDNPYTSYDTKLFNVDGMPMNEITFGVYFRRLNDECNFGYKGTFRFFRSHALRKFFASTLRRAGYDSLDTEFLLGHAVKNVLQDAYVKRDLERMENQYLRIMPELSINPIKTNVFESMEYKRLKRENAEIRKIIAQMKDTMDEFINSNEPGAGLYRDYVRRKHER
jgi:integrase